LDKLQKKRGEEGMIDILYMEEIYIRQALSFAGATVMQPSGMPCFSLDLFTVSIIIRPYSKSAKEQGNV
jgi:hypothetical protein